MDDRSVAELHDAVRTAVEHGEVERAAALRDALAATEPTVEELLDQFTTAIENGDTEKARTILNKLGQRYAEKRTAEMKDLQAAMLARDSSGVTRKEALTLQRYIHDETGRQMLRSGFLTSALAALSDEQTDDTDATGQAKKLKQQEQSTDRRREEANDQSSQATLPPDVEIIEVDVPDRATAGETIEVTVRFTNVGDSAASDVVIRIESEGLTVSPTRQEVGRVESGVDGRATFDVTTSEPGSRTVGIEISSENAGTSNESLLIEVDKRREQSPGPVEAIAGDDGVVDFQEVVSAISLYNQNKLVPGTDQTLSFQDVLEIIARYNEGGEKDG